MPDKRSVYEMRVARLQERLRRMDERIGRLMSERVTIEERIAEELSAMKRAGDNPN